MGIRSWWRGLKRKTKHYRLSDVASDQAYGDPLPERINNYIWGKNPEAEHRVPEKIPALDTMLLPPSHTHAHYWWGGSWRQVDEEMYHMFFLGKSGSGKSNLSLITMSNLALSVTPGSDRRMIIFASKRDALETLEGLGVKYTVFNLNDSRSPGWDMAKDYFDISKADDVATMCVPDDPHGERIWTDGARAIVSGVFKSFVYRHGSDWGVDDLYNAATSDKKTLIKILSQCPANRDVIDTVLKSVAEKTEAGMRIQVLTTLKRLYPLAAHYQHAEHFFSLSDFLRSESILVVQPDLDEWQAIKPIIHALFQRLSELTAALPGDDLPRRIFVSLDEAQFMGKIPGVAQFATFSRSKGGVLMLSSQTIDGLYKEYGREEAESILANCDFVTLLKQKNKVSAEWGVSQFGSLEMWEVNESRTTSYQGGSQSESGRWQRRPRILDTDLLNLPLSSRKTGIQGYFIPPESRDAFKLTIPGEVIDALRPPRKHVPTPNKKPMSHYMVLPWSMGKYAKFVENLEPDSYEFYRAVAGAASDVMQDLLKEFFTEA